MPLEGSLHSLCLCWGCSDLFTLVVEGQIFCVLYFQIYQLRSPTLPIFSVLGTAFSIRGTGVKKMVVLASEERGL